MGKTNKFVSFLLAVPLGLVGSCTQEPVLYEGTANVRIESESFQDTLKSCTCWFSSDELSVMIGNVQLSGILVDVTSQKGIYRSRVRFVQDTNEDLNGTALPVEEQRLEVKYSLDDERIVLDGTLRLQSSWQYPEAESQEKLLIEGNFHCELTEKER